MDKESAEKALAIIRGVIENTREDLAAHNWGLIWIVHAFTNAFGFASIGFFVERHDKPLFFYLVPLAVVAVVNLLLVAALGDRDRGVRSFVEWQVHGIWLTFIVFTLAVAAVLQLSGASPRLFGPLVAVTSGIGFAMMGVLFSRRFFALAVLFLLLAVVLPLEAVAPVQWYLVAAAWWLAMIVPGIALVRERQRRQRDERRTRIL
jgi:hypothetical protein